MREKYGKYKETLFRAELENLKEEIGMLLEQSLKIMFDFYWNYEGESHRAAIEKLRQDRLYLRQQRELLKSKMAKDNRIIIFTVDGTDISMISRGDLISIDDISSIVEVNL